MTADTDPIRALTATVDLADLRRLVDRGGPFLTLVVPSPSAVGDARSRLDTRWRSARSSVADRWPEDRLAALDEVFADLPHDGGEAIAIVQPADGPPLVEFLLEPVDRTVAHVDPLPRLATIIESRQRTLPHLVVDTDRTGATIIAFDGGAVIGREDVEGETLHIHRGHPGGWSQRRFQQRAENRWEQNADEVADAAVDLARRVDPVLVAVAGEVRAQSLVVEALDGRVTAPVVKLESGDPDGIADEIVRLVSDHVARGQRAAAERLREGRERGLSVATAAETLEALAEGRVATLLVDDDDRDDDRDEAGGSPDPTGARSIDVAIRAALDTDAEIVIMPRVAAMDGPLAALLRW